MNIRSTFTTLIAAAALVATLPFAAQARSMNDLNYTVLRDGKPIGTHAIKIEENGGRTTVGIASDVKVKVLFVTAYEFTQTSTEVWENGHLVSLTSKTHDDNAPSGSKKWTLSAESGAGGLAVKAVDDVAKAQKVDAAVPAATLPASLWNAATVKQSTLLNTVDGSVMTVAIADKGAEDVAVKGATVKATHYSITGDLKRELWIDANGNVVQYTFEDKTGSLISYVLR